LITFTISYHMLNLLMNNWRLTSNWSNIWIPSRGFASNCITTIKIIAIAKAFDNNQWPLD
jgi:hypothetical protein